MFIHNEQGTHMLPLWCVDYHNVHRTFDCLQSMAYNHVAHTLQIPYLEY